MQVVLKTFLPKLHPIHPISKNCFICFARIQKSTAKSESNVAQRKRKIWLGIKVGIMTRVRLLTQSTTTDCGGKMIDLAIIEWMCGCLYIFQTICNTFADWRLKVWALCVLYCVVTNWLIDCGWFMKNVCSLKVGTCWALRWPNLNLDLKMFETNEVTFHRTLGVEEEGAYAPQVKVFLKQM